MLAEVQGGKALRAERWHRRRDGTPVWGSCRSTPLRNSASEVVGCLNIFHDHSAERQARDMLLGLNRQLASRIAMRIAALEHADHRQEADPRPHSDTADADDGAASPTPSGEKILGQLTGGIAHDFNNLLTAIIGGLELTRRQVNDARSQRLIDGALAAAHRGAHLVSQLLAFSRQQMLHQEPVSLASLVTEACPLLERTAGSAITLRTALKRDVWPVMIDPHQMRIALVNLVANARDAMPTGGVLRIAVRNLATKAPSGRAGTREASPRGDWVAIEVHDSGAGMTHEVKARFFEPFFTTKPVGAGAGLGLAQVYGFIRQSGGDVRIETRVGHGTRIRLLLPRIASA
jgi:signal transduction histidine kinase